MTHTPHDHIAASINDDEIIEAMLNEHDMRVPDAQLADPSGGKYLANRDGMRAAFAIAVLTIQKIVNSRAPVQQQEAGWPMETAPKDGTAILIQTADFGWVEGYWDSTVLHFYKSNPDTAVYNPNDCQGDWCSSWRTPGDMDKRLYCGASPKSWLPLPGESVPPSASSSPEREPIKIVGIECYELTAEEKIILENFKVAQRNSIEELVATYPGLKGKL